MLNLYSLGEMPESIRSLMDKESALVPVCNLLPLVLDTAFPQPSFFPNVFSVYMLTLSLSCRHTSLQGLWLHVGTPGAYVPNSQLPQASSQGNKFASQIILTASNGLGRHMSFSSSTSEPPARPEDLTMMLTP